MTAPEVSSIPSHTLPVAPWTWLPRTNETADDGTPERMTTMSLASTSTDSSPPSVPWTQPFPPHACESHDRPPIPSHSRTVEPSKTPSNSKNGRQLAAVQALMIPEVRARATLARLHRRERDGVEQLPVR